MKMSRLFAGMIVLAASTSAFAAEALDIRSYEGVHRGSTLADYPSACSVEIIVGKSAQGDTVQFVAQSAGQGRIESTMFLVSEINAQFGANGSFNVASPTLCDQKSGICTASGASAGVLSGGKLNYLNVSTDSHPWYPSYSGGRVDFLCGHFEE